MAVLTNALESTKYIYSLEFLADAARSKTAHITGGHLIAIHACLSPYSEKSISERLVGIPFFTAGVFTSTARGLVQVCPRIIPTTISVATTVPFSKKQLHEIVKAAITTQVIDGVTDTMIQLIVDTIDRIMEPGSKPSEIYKDFTESYPKSSWLLKKALLSVKSTAISMKVEQIFN